MTNKLIKVDRVRSAGEAVQLEALGADLLGVDLGPDPRFGDGREITVEEAVAIDQALGRAALVPAMNLADDPSRILRVAQAVKARLVQPIGLTVPPAATRAALSEAGIGIVYGGSEIAHDDDPGWVFSEYTDEPELNASYFQADIVPEYRDSWAFLRDRAPEFEDEFQIEDLENLAAEHPLLVGLDFEPGNVGEISTALPSVRGFVFTLAEKARRGGVRFRSYPQTLLTLRALG